MKKLFKCKLNIKVVSTNIITKGCPSIKELSTTADSRKSINLSTIVKGIV